MSRKRIIAMLILAVLALSVWALANYQRSRKVGELLAQLADVDQFKAMEAMEQLKHRGRFVGPRLAENLSSPDPNRRWRTAMLAAEIGYRGRAVREQIVSLVSDKDPNVRRAAIVACGRLRLAEAEGPLGNILYSKSEDPMLRALAAASLGMIQVRGAVKTLAAVLEQRRPVPAKDKDKEKPQTTAKSESEKASGQATTEKVTAGGSTEKEATEANASTTEKKTATDDTWQVRMECALALGQIGSPEAVEPLSRSVQQDLEPKVDVRVAAAYALADLGAVVSDQQALTRVVEALIKAMGDEAGDVRIAAAMGLGRVFPPKSLRSQVEQVLREHADDEHYWVREAVKYAARQLAISLAASS
ncbi:MAG: HEAT repeat domain-containing protein [Armatimonadetes bacterium]|nr:HEAT repeat domain-containing protein [Armatimonadota bacterium]